jgi:hypothetical protein
MNKIIFIFLLIAWGNSGVCQTAISDSVSIKIARKMKDSLQLTSALENQILEINKFLAAQKQLVRRDFTSMDSLRIHIQKIEMKRDTLYSEILGAKHTLYLQKKHKLVNNN